MPVGMKPLVLTSVEVGLSDLTCHQIVRHLHPSYMDPVGQTEDCRE